MLIISDGQKVIKFQKGEAALAKLEKQALTPSDDVQEISRRGVVNAVKMAIYLGVYVQQNAEYVLNKQGVFALLDAYAEHELTLKYRPRLEEVVKTAADDVAAYGELDNLDSARLEIAAKKLATTPETLLDLLNVILQHALTQEPALHFKIEA